MLDREWIDKRICHIEKHGNDESDVHNLAMLYFVREHIGKGYKVERLTHEDAIRWVDGMESEDPAKTHGGKWTMDQVKPVAQKYGVPTEGEHFIEFWATMNMLYSDYYLVAKKYNLLNPDFFADLSMAFINDKDAVKNKTAMYYTFIAKR